MAKRGKKYRVSAEKVEHNKKYELAEAVKILKGTHFAKFNESVDLQIRLGVDPRNSEQQVRGTVVLPHGTGKSVRVAVFAKGDAATAAKDAGAEFVGAEDLVEKIEKGWTDFDAAVATPDMMRIVSKVGKTLGPRGLMPNPKAGTVTPNVAQVIKELKAGKVEYKLDRQAIIHCTVGKINFEEKALAENIQVLLDAVHKARPASTKGTYMKSIAVSSTMSPGIRLNYAE
ncbi:50S ribosomal protein L1 [Candidatus Sumerlaeota bacterium]|nr:50S ribosomal protein L1 [Candidatus Sumerlaeota bacterium]